VSPQTLLTQRYPLLKAQINSVILFTEHFSVALPIKITMYQRIAEKVLQDLDGITPRQHWLCKHLQPPHFWPGPHINVVLGHFGERTSAPMHSNWRWLWVYKHAHICVLSNIFSQVRLSAPRACPTPSPTRSCAGSCACNGDLHFRKMIRGNVQWSRLYLSSLKKVLINLHEIIIKQVFSFPWQLLFWKK